MIGGRSTRARPPTALRTASARVAAFLLSGCGVLWSCAAEPDAADAEVVDAPAAESFGFGAPASAELVAAWDIDIGPDGAGLPPGRGTVREGLEIYAEKCAACHGPTGREGPNDLLAPRLPDDGFPFATDRSARSTVGNYWPYATTLFDYTRRAMPFDRPGSLTDEEVYALVGALLHFNDLLPADAVVDSAAVVDVRMPARDRFVPDDRAGGPEIR